MHGNGALHGTSTNRADEGCPQVCALQQPRSDQSHRRKPCTEERNGNAEGWRSTGALGGPSCFGYVVIGYECAKAVRSAA